MLQLLQRVTLSLERYKRLEMLLLSRTWKREEVELLSDRQVNLNLRD